MMITEFTQLTGFYPTADLYAAIEAAYNISDMSKEEFCAAYRANRDGMAERITFNVNWDATMNELTAERKTKEHIDSMEAEIARLREALEREEEWRDYGFESRMTQEAYEELAQSAKHLTDTEAAAYVAAEFGFNADSVKIRRKLDRYQINRHNRLRKCGSLEREPIYESTDWNYVAFEVNGLCWEMVNGDLVRA